MYSPQQKQQYTYNSAPSPAGYGGGYGGGYGAGGEGGYGGGPTYTPHRYGSAPAGGQGYPERTPLLGSAPAYAVPASDTDHYHDNRFVKPRQPCLNKRAIWGVCAAVTLAVLLAVAVTAYFLFPRMPTIERKGESNLALQLVPFALNFTENFVIDNPNYVSLSVHSINMTVYHRSVAVGKTRMEKKHVFPGRTFDQPFGVVVTLDNPAPEVLAHFLDDCGLKGELPLHLNGTVDAGYSVAHHSFFLGFDIILPCRN